MKHLFHYIQNSQCLKCDGKGRNISPIKNIEPVKVPAPKVDKKSASPLARFKCNKCSNEWIASNTVSIY